METEEYMKKIRTYIAVESDEDGEPTDALPAQVADLDDVTKVIEELVHRYKTMVRRNASMVNGLGIDYAERTRQLKKIVCMVRASNAQNEMLLAERRSESGALTAGSTGDISFWFKVAEYWRKKLKEL